MTKSWSCSPKGVPEGPSKTRLLEPMPGLHDFSEELAFKAFSQERSSGCLGGRAGTCVDFDGDETFGLQQLIASSGWKVHFRLEGDEWMACSKAAVNFVLV